MSTAGDGHETWTFGDFSLDIDRGSLLRYGQEVKLRPQSFAVLTYLVKRHGILVTKKELLDAVWGKKAVTDDSLTHCLIDIRKALGDSTHQQIRTVPRRGFIFEIDVRDPVDRTASADAAVNRWRLVAVVAIAIGAIAIWSGVIDTRYRSPMNIAVVDVSEKSIADLKSALLSGAQSEEPSPAYDLYLQGMFIYNRRGPGDVQTARSYFLQAVDLDPAFAAAWAGLAGAYRVLLFANEIDATSGLELFRNAAETAVKLDPDLPEGKLRLAQAYLLSGQRELGVQLIEQTLAENPDNSLALGITAEIAARSGDIDRAIELQRRASIVDPLNAISHGNLSNFLAAAGRYAEAIVANRRLSNLSPDLQEVTDAELAKLYVLTGRYEDALAIILQCPASLAQDHALALVYDAMGRATEAQGHIRRLVAANDPDSAIRLAEIYANNGNYDASFERLQSVYEWFDLSTSRLASSDYLTRIVYSPFLRPLHQDERWAEWLMNART